MTATETIYPYDVKQTTGGHYQVFDGLGKIKQASGYAVSARPIDYKNGNTYTPSAITAYFKLQIPINAEIRKVTVQYRHYVDKLAISKGYPITTPTIILASKANSKTFNKKGNAATKTSTMRTATFTNVEVDVNSFFNNGNFRVQLKYGKNSTNNYGKVHLAYIRVRVEYVTPDFDVSMSKVSGGYNREELSLKATISNKNLTKGNPVVNISLPLGLSFVRANGNGTVTQPQNRTLVWTPVVNRAGSVSVEIIVVPNVSYSSSDKVWSGSIAYSMPSFNRSRSLTVTVTERPPAEDESKADEEPDIDSQGSSSMSSKESYPPIEAEYNVPISLNGEHIDIGWAETVKFIWDNDSFNYQHLIMVSEIPMKLEIVAKLSQKTWGINKVIETFILTPGEETLLDCSDWHSNFEQKYGIKIQYTDFLGRTVYPRLYMRLSSLSQDKGNVWWWIHESYTYDRTGEEIVSNTYADGFNINFFLTEKQYASLGVVNFAKIKPSEEETHRLGDGYTYTLQSDMQLNTSEDYVRNWYKNFRIGVFNNPITANQHSYILLQTEEDSQVRDLTIPSRFDLTDATMSLTVDNPLTAIINETTYNLTSTTEIPLWEDYSQSITFQKVSDNVTLTLELYDANNVLLWSQEYHLVFDAEETILPLPVTEDSTDYTNLTNEQIFSNAEWWSETQAGLNTSNNVECQFTYDENYPLYIIYTGDYPEGDPNNNTVTFNEPCIIEDYEQRLTNGLFIEPIDDSIKDDGSLSTITMKAFDISNTVVLYDLPLDDNYGTNTDMAIRGIELTGEVEQTDRLILYAKLRSPTGESRQRSIIIKDTNDFSIGGNGDLWGYNTLDMINLEDWEIELTISNNLEEVDGNLIFGNLQLNIYVERVEPSNIVCYINGEDLRYYGVFITDVSIPEGLQTDTRYLEVDGTDHNDPYNQSIRQKEIEIEFELGNDCDLQANTLSRRELAKLLVNDRDEYNRPIPNTIEFSHYPDIYWEYIMEEAIADKIEIGSYTDGKVTLVVPAGTAYDKESTTTSNTGYVNGLATINPILIVKPTDEIITIREEVTGQEFHMGYSGEWNDKILEIDCEDRIVWLKTDEDDTDPINLNRYVDFNSDWFRLKGEFSFSGINCIIRTVDYQERW